MKPYLAIIADSFREALASRILWILLILITLFLLALSPLGFRAEQMTEFQQGDFLDARAFVAAVHEDFDRGTPSPGQRLWSMFDEPLRQTLSDFERADKDDFHKYFTDLPKLLEALNKTLEDRQFHDAQVWQGVLLGSEARELLERGSDTLSDEDLARLNRLLIITPYDKYFRTGPPKQLRITYFGWNGLWPPIRANEKLVKQIIEQAALPLIIRGMVGFFGLFAAIVVTASIIPQMFDSGSLSLLLSKPVSRSFMFLAKFLGGCAFILINATYFLVGLWLIVGLRLGIWSQGLLLCIPIFLFLFAIYYSVSAITGVIWRNAIVCVVLTVVFYFTCYAVGMIKGIFQQIAVENKRLIHLVQASDTLIALDENKATYRWEAAAAEWQPVFLEGGGGMLDRVLGPIYDAEKHMLYASHASDRGMFGSSHTLLVGKESGGWKQEDGPSLPDGTWELLPDPRGRLLAITETGVQQLTGDLETQTKKLQLLWMEIPQSLAKPFRSAGPATPLKLASPKAAAVDPQSGNVVTYSCGELTLLVRQGDDYQMARTASVELEDKEQEALVVFAGSDVLLALSDGRIMDFETPALTLRGTYEPEPESQPRFACTSPDGQACAIVFHNGRLHVLNTTQREQATLQLADVRGQGDISAAAFAADNSLLVADRVNRVTSYDRTSGEQLQTYAPALTALEIAYYYVIVPVHTVFRPGELANTIQHVMSKEDPLDMGMLGGGLETKRMPLHPWTPVRNSLIFMLVVLALACVYIERQDF